MYAGVRALPFSVRAEQRAFQIRLRKAASIFHPRSSATTSFQIHIRLPLRKSNLVRILDKPLVTLLRKTSNLFHLLQRGCPVQG